jgi:hypothetical protein
MENSPCRCIIRHAITPDERAEIGKDLQYYRSIGDRRGIILSLAMLQPCPSVEDPVELDDESLEELAEY